MLPDLRYSAALGTADVWQNIVHDGVKQANGMIAFAPVLSPAEVETIRQYVIHRAHAK